MQSQDTAALKTALATMRPSNLAEPEDLSELLPLLTQAKNVRDKSTSLREAIDYADMVVQYVNDGSGTRDLITKAMQQLRKAQGLPWRATSCELGRHGQEMLRLLDVK